MFFWRGTVRGKCDIISSTASRPRDAPLLGRCTAFALPRPLRGHRVGRCAASPIAPRPLRGLAPCSVAARPAPRPLARLYHCSPSLRRRSLITQALAHGCHPKGSHTHSSEAGGILFRTGGLFLNPRKPAPKQKFESFAPSGAQADQPVTQQAASRPAGKRAGCDRGRLARLYAGERAVR